jgi:hypothetical protein
MSRMLYDGDALMLLVNGVVQEKPEEGRAASDHVGQQDSLALMASGREFANGKN